MPKPSARRALPLLLLAGLLLVPAIAEAGARLAGKPYRDRVHKFSVKVFDDWSQVPLQADETIVVAKFAEEGDRGGWLPPPQMEIVRVNKRDGGDQPTVTGGMPPEIARRMGLVAPTSAWDATIGRLGLPEELQPDPEDFKAVESKDDVEGRLYRFEYPYGAGRIAPQDGRELPTYFAALIVFEKDEIEYGIFFRAPESRRKDIDRNLKRIAGSFRFFDERAEDVEQIDDLDGVNISAERRREIEKGLIEGWDVVVSKKKQYIVLYNTQEGRNHQLAKEIARRIELIREQVYEEQFPPAKPIEAVSVVRVCGDRKEYHQYGGPGGSAGYWNSAAEELVFYDAARSKKIDDDTLAVLYHEAFHQYIFYSAGDVAPHSWFNEGHGDYYSGADLRGRRFTIKPFRWRTGIIKNAVAKGPREKVEVEGPDGTVRTRYANDGGYTPLEDFVRFTQREYYSYPGISYAQGWSFIYFLREEVPKKKSYREKWGHILDTYFETLKAAAAEQHGGAWRPPGFPVPPGDGDGEDGGAEDPGPVTPGEPGGEDDEADEEEDPTTFIPPPSFGRRGGAAALQKALEAAFDGVDMDELEKAWLDSV